ncbi:Fe-S cluster assembly ATPase SufC [Candidatus Woesearchaeota archaeon]|nr:Fe-S cluster assembly ATPase SufC [Candidatus Woesearchaeota archaeon]
MDELVIKDLHVNVEGKEILKGLSLTVKKGQVAALMGPNGSGKSTLAYTIMGHPGYEIAKGEIWFKGKNLAQVEADERSRMGVFLSFQYPQVVSGVSLSNFLRTAVNARRPEDDPVPVVDFAKQLREKMEMLKIDPAFAGRYVNEGFSGGEKKRTEILQMAVLEPEMAILDETDSGLDIDALRTVAEGVNRLKSEKMGILLITHYQRILNYVTPDVVHVIVKGRIVKTGGKELALKLEEKGYDWILKELEQAAKPLARPKKR